MDQTHGGTKLVPYAYSTRDASKFWSRANLPSRYSSSRAITTQRTNYDNFYTPLNNSFYASSQYLELDQKGERIRLLRVQFASQRPRVWGASPNNGPLECHLENNVLLSSADSVPYYALSYCAGDPKDTSVIRVNGMPFNAFKNLEHALRCVRDHLATERKATARQDVDFRVWVDQICINQSDKEERASQVQIMRGIYRRARQTFVCLSTPEVPDCLSWAPQLPCSSKLPRGTALSRQSEHPIVTMFKKTIQVLLLGSEVVMSGSSDLDQDSEENSRDEDTPWASQSAKSLYSKLSFRSSVHSLREQKDYEIVKPPYIDPDRFQDSLHAFMTRPWWRRAWIYQELLCSDRVEVISGSISLDWSELSPLIYFMRFGWGEVAREALSYARSTLKRHHTQAQEWEDNQRSKHLRALEEYRLKCSALKRKQKLDWEAAYRQQEKDRKSYRQQQMDFFAFAHKSALNEYQNTKVWCISQRSKLKTEIQTLERHFEDRRRPIEDQIQDAPRLGPCSINSKTHRRRLEELARVPDHHLWYNWYDYKEPPEPIFCKPTNPYHGKTGSIMLWEIRLQRIKSIIKHVKGLDMEHIVSLARDKDNFKGSRELKALLRHSRRVKSSDPRDRVYAFLGVALDGYNITPNYHRDNTVVAVLVEAGMKIIQMDQSLALLEHVYRGRNRLGPCLPTWTPDWTSTEEMTPVQHFLTLDESDAFQKRLKRRSFDASKGCSVVTEFRSDYGNPGKVALGVLGVRVDLLDELHLDHKHEVYQGFVTELGNVVITSKSARVGDELWILYGASMPALLRSEGVMDEDGREKYAFLGEALVFDSKGERFSDIMYGLAVPEDCLEAAETEELWLI